MQIFPTATNPGQQSYFRVSSPAVILDTIKKAEDSEDIVVRLYEAHGSQETVRLFSTLPILSAQRCNLLEDDTDDKEIRWAKDGLEFEMMPFEIISFKLKLAKTG